MLTLLIIQDLTDSTREAAWAHGASMGPVLCRVVWRTSTQTLLLFVRDSCKESLSGIVFDSGRHVSLRSVPCFDVTQPATFWGGAVCTLFSPLCLLYCEDTAHFQQVWAPGSRNKALGSFWSASLLNTICSKGIFLFWLIICWWIIEISITFGSQDSRVDIAQTFNMKAFYEKLLSRGTGSPLSALAWKGCGRQHKHRVWLSSVCLWDCNAS